MKTKQKRDFLPKGNAEPVSHEEVDRAMEEFLKKGGKIEVIQPLWLEEGSLYPPR